MGDYIVKVLIPSVTVAVSINAKAYSLAGLVFCLCLFTHLLEIQESKGKNNG